MVAENRLTPLTSRETVPQPRVLLIDDDDKWCRQITSYLGRHDLVVTAVLTGREGLELAMTQPWDLVVLDVMLPDVDGFEVLKAIRRVSKLPVLMLTARGDESDRIDGLEIGADEYVPKQFSIREILARIRAVIRRTAESAAPKPPGDVLTIGELRINLAAYRVFLAGDEIVLAPVEYALLLTLARNLGRAKTRDELFNEISDRSPSLERRAIDVHVSTLRRKLGESLETPRYIRTVRSVGYMLVNPDTPA